MSFHNRIAYVNSNFHERSDPKSSKYGQHYKVDEIHDLFAPSSASVEAVRTWLHDAGIRGVSQSTNRQWLQFDANASEVQRLLKTKFHLYEHSKTGRVTVGCDEYGLFVLAADSG